MDKLRLYGTAPYDVAVLHGGPGAPGEVAPVAKELAKSFGVLEPFQSENTIEGQIVELKSIIEEYGQTPITLIGYSWGAWLSFMFAAHYPALVKKVILVGCGAFEEKYVPNMNLIRTRRLSDKDNIRLKELVELMMDPNAEGKKTVFKEFGALMSKADSYKPLPYVDDILDFQFDVFESVMNEITALRKSGELIKMGEQIQCPVIAIHGTYDPHPVDGVKKPLLKVLKDFRFILLENCGHAPWNESMAKDEFYDILRKELR